MSHELVAFPNGSFSVKPLLSQEAMHSHIGPWQEARTIYVEQSGLLQLLSQPGPPITVYDLGMGIAANALAAWECFAGADPARDLRIVSFEKHLDGLRLAIQNLERFEWLARHVDQAKAILANRETTFQKQNAKLRWQLHEGDFTEQDLRALPAADLVFFDFYSPKEDPELWGVPCFAKVRAAASENCVLLTYGASTAARSSMLLAGFYVGVGAPTAAKTETTVAATRLQNLAQPLGRAWLDKLARSDKPFAGGLERNEALARIHEHPQFAPTHENPR